MRCSIAAVAISIVVAACGSSAAPSPAHAPSPAPAASPSVSTSPTPAASSSASPAEIETDFHAKFLKNCAGDEARLNAYCECTWNTLRPQLSASELVDAELSSTDRYAALKPDLIKTCGSNVPDSLARELFMAGCGNEPAHVAFCECSWKTLRTRHAPVDFVESNLNLDVERPKIAKACGTHDGK
ncbi:MAG: hypothetical protein ACHREM_22545 [Polyangiales bacterium]